MPRLTPLRCLETGSRGKLRSPLSACIKEHTQLKPFVKNLLKTEGSTNEYLGRDVTGKK